MNIREAERKRQNVFKFWFVVVTAVIFLGLVICGMLLLNRSGVIEDVTIEAGTPITLDIFFDKKVRKNTSFITDMSEVRTDVPGLYDIGIMVGDEAYSSLLHIVDTVAPRAEALEDIKTWGGILPDAASCVKNVEDATEVKIEWLSTPDVQTDGEHVGSVSVTDASGNKTEVGIKITVTVDTAPPMIEGVQDFTLYIGDALDYTSGITVTDSQDQNPTLTVDDSMLDPAVPGEYVINYTATDGAGNKTYASCAVKLIADTVAPTISGVSDFTTCVNLAVDYKSGVTATDNSVTPPAIVIADGDVSFDKPGTYKVTYTATDGAGNKATATATITVVADTTAPEIRGAVDYKIPVGTNFNCDSVVSVADNWDAQPKLVIDGTVNTKVAGNYNVIYTATDFSGNVTVKKCLYSVGTDTTPPTVAPENFVVYVGESASYKKHVSVTDDYYGVPKLKIDNSAVNLNAVGNYTVTYTATDASGNSASASAIVSVINKPTTEELVVAMANDILDKITNSNMTVMEKAFAIYLWTRRNVKYIGTSDKTDWIEGAYEGFTTHRGDCFTYYAVARALLTQAGIQNLEVTRDSTTSTHFWNFINIGTGWYHFDACLFTTGTGRIFMLTDEEAYAWDAMHKENGHTYKTELLPPCSTVSVQHMVDYDAGVLVGSY